MAKKNEDFGVEELVKGLTSLRKDVREIRVNMLASIKPAFTNQEAMEIFGISSATLKSWRDNGILGYSQIGKIYLYSKEDIREFLENYHFDTFKSTKEFVKSIKDE